MKLQTIYTCTYHIYMKHVQFHISNLPRRDIFTLKIMGACIVYMIWALIGWQLRYIIANLFYMRGPLSDDANMRARATLVWVIHRHFYPH